MEVDYKLYPLRYFIIILIFCGNLGLQWNERDERGPIFLDAFHFIKFADVVSINWVSIKRIIFFFFKKKNKYKLSNKVTAMAVATIIARP